MKTTHRVAVRNVAAALAVFAAAGCNAIFGFEERTLEEPELCDQYCKAIGDACRDDDKQYDDSSVCLTACNRIASSDNETIAESIGCRLEFARQAASITEPGEKLEACRSAGFGTLDRNSSSSCGDACELYCNLMATVCPDEDLPEVGEPCSGFCLALEREGDFTAADAFVNEGGDTLQCRLWHLANATKQSEPHCGHANGSQFCSNPGTGSGGGGAGGGG